MTINTERLAQVTTLKSGSHEPNDDAQFCVMEAVAYVAGEPWSDHPACTCPVITTFMVSWNDGLPGDLREKIAGIIVRKVLQEDYDDLVEGYLDEILMAADEIILLPAYRAVAEAYYSRLSLIQSERGEA